MGSLGPLVVGIALAFSPSPQPQATPSLTEASSFVRSLTLDPAVDRERFDAVGQQRAATLLAAVMGAGQTPQATAADWESMHRAVDGLVELYRRRAARTVVGPGGAGQRATGGRARRPRRTAACVARADSRRG